MRTRSISRIESRALSSRSALYRSSHWSTSKHQWFLSIEVRKTAHAVVVLAAASLGPLVQILRLVRPALNILALESRVSMSEGYAHLVEGWPTGLGSTMSVSTAVKRDLRLSIMAEEVASVEVLVCSAPLLVPTLCL